MPHINDSLAAMNDALSALQAKIDALLGSLAGGLSASEFEARVQAATQEAIDSVMSQLSDLDVTALQVQQAIIRKVMGQINAYGPDKYLFEYFDGDFSVADQFSRGGVVTVAGDDSVDISSTTDIVVGREYVIETPEKSVVVQVMDILSSSRFRCTEQIAYSLADATLRRTNWAFAGGQATATAGQVYYSKLISLDATSETKALVLRRTLSEAVLRLYYRAADATQWTEALWRWRRDSTYGAYDFGLNSAGPSEDEADYEYELPVAGEFELKIVCSVPEGVDAATTTEVKHIVGLNASTGLGGVINPDIRPDTPSMASPANGATDVPETPTLAVARYLSPGDVAQAAIEFQVATGQTFADADIVYSSGQLPAVLACAVPAGVLPADTIYYVRARTMDLSGQWSDWSVATSFTTKETYAGVVTPTIVAPTSGATDVGPQPTLSAAAFAVSGGEDTHAASQWRIREVSGSWDAPLWDSGEDAVNLLSVMVPSGVLHEGQVSYALQTRQKGAVLGWSEWSAEVIVTTKTVFANVIGVALLTAGGDGGGWAHVDGDGATITPAAAVFSAHPVWGGMQDVTIDGQAMVKIPRFYVRRDVIASGVNSGKEAWWISDVAQDGFHIHPAFRNAGTDLDCVYVGKYQASVAGSKLASIAGVMPAVSRSLTDFQGLAAARNASGVSGFRAWSAFHWAAIQWLYLVEMATMDSQTATGQGRVTASSAAAVDASDVAQATYRGIVGLWGNIWQLMDGLKTAAGVVQLWDGDGDQTWVNTGQTPPNINTWTYPVTFVDAAGAGFDMANVFVAATGLTAPSGATAPDGQYWDNTTTYYPAVGGNWGYVAKAGMWAIACSHAATTLNPDLGSRLAKV